MIAQRSKVGAACSSRGVAGMQQPQPLLPHQHASSNNSDNHSHSAHSQSHSHSLPRSPSPLNGVKQQQQTSKPNLALPSASSLAAPPLVPPHPLKQSSLSPSSRNNRVSPTPTLPSLPPPLPSKPPSRSRPSSASRGRLTKAEGETDESSASALLQATGLTSDVNGTHVSPLSTARTPGSKKLKTDSPPPLLPPPTHPSFVNGGMTLSHFPSDEEEDADCTIITTTVVTATEQEETREHIHNNLISGQREAEDDETEPGAAEAEESSRRGNGLRLGLRLGGFEEAKEDSEITTIPVFQEEEQKEERRKPKLTLQHLSSHTSSSPHNLPRLPLTLATTSSRPHTPQKGLHLHPDDTSTDGASGDSIIITTTTTTTTTTTSTQMRLLPLAATPSHASSSAPFVPSKQSNMATTQSTSSRAAKLDFFLHDWYAHIRRTPECTTLLSTAVLSLSHSTVAVCSCVYVFSTLITPTLYIGGQIVASDRALLHQHGITHVVNACGAVCDNYFPEDFSYYRLYLQDKGSEDVLCILYEVYHFISAARASGGKTLIHCQQGVSRSTVLGIGYLMMAGEESENSEWTYADYQIAYSMVRSKRGISSPNLGFVCQLLAWSRRLLGRCAFSSSLYRFAPHNNNDRKLVNKW